MKRKLFLSLIAGGLLLANRAWAALDCQSVINANPVSSPALARRAHLQLMLLALNTTYFNEIAGNADPSQQGATSKVIAAIYNSSQDAATTFCVVRQYFQNQNGHNDLSGLANFQNLLYNISTRIHVANGQQAPYPQQQSCPCTYNAGAVPADCFNIDTFVDLVPEVKKADDAAGKRPGKEN